MSVAALSAASGPTPAASPPPEGVVLLLEPAHTTHVSGARALARINVMEGRHVRNKSYSRENGTHQWGGGDGHVRVMLTSATYHSKQHIT